MSYDSGLGAPLFGLEIRKEKSWMACLKYEAQMIWCEKKEY